MTQDSIRILIVDDVPAVRQGLAIMLKLAGRNIAPRFEVIGEAKNGIDAIMQAKLLHPDVVLMDLNMPGLDGYTATQTIKSANPAILIVALSIHGDPASRQKVIQSGADAFVEKGGPLESLFQAIQSCKTST